MASIRWACSGAAGSASPNLGMNMNDEGMRVFAYRNSKPTRLL